MTELDSNRIAEIYADRGPINISADTDRFILLKIQEIGLDLLEYLNSKPNPQVLDLCCGQGAVGFALWQMV